MSKHHGAKKRRKANAEVAELRAEVETLRSAGMMTGAGGSPEDAEFDITEDEIDAMMAAGEPIELMRKAGSMSTDHGYAALANDPEVQAEAERRARTVAVVFHPDVIGDVHFYASMDNQRPAEWIDKLVREEIGRRITAEIEADPREVARVRRAREHAAIGRIGKPGDDDFYEDDESIEEVFAAFDRGVHGVTAPPLEADALREALRQAQFKTTPWQRED